MVESLKELNRICQKPRYRETGNWMVRHILRDAALPITWALLHTPVTANQVTTFSLIVGLAGIYLFSLVTPAAYLWGAILLQLWYLLDHVDGQVARYRGTVSLTGRFFDFITHHVIHGFLFFALGFYQYRVTGSSFFIWWGFVTSSAMTIFNLTYDTQYKTFVEKLCSFKGAKVLDAPTQTTKKSNRSLVRQGFSWLHKSCEIHVAMNLLTLGALLEILLKFPIQFRSIFFVFYGILVPLITVAKLVYLISGRKIDSEFKQTFSEITKETHV